MAFFCAQAGRISFADGLRLYAGMPAGELGERCRNPASGVLTVCLDARAVRGGGIAPVCTLDAQGLRAVVLHACQVGAKTPVKADRQRAFLFAALRLRDPCPDTRRCVKVRYPFGEIAIYSDPYTGTPAARIEYDREPSGEERT